MLVLSRKKNQSVVIDSSIEVFVVDVNQDQVKLGFVAPKNMQILRKEIHVKVQQEMKAAATSDPNVLKKITDELVRKRPLPKSKQQK